jgi:hypothetical protein
MSTALLAKLKAVFTDGSTPAVSTPMVQPLALAQFTAGHILVECVNSDGTAHALTYDTLILGVRLHPTDASAAISVQGSNLDVDDEGQPADNWCKFELVPGHWVNCEPRIYGYDVVALVGGNPDDRIPVVPHSQWKTTPENVHPGDDVQVPASEPPLAPGPPGPRGAQGPKGDNGSSLTCTALKTADYTAASGDFVLCDPSGGTFNITLPDSGMVVVKNDSDSENVIGVHHPSQLIDGSFAAYVIVGPRAAAQFIGDGIAWRVF